MDPSVEELRTVAQFNIGDVVWTASSGPWKVTARYWIRSQQRIAYDLEFANGMKLRRMLDDEVYDTRQWYGYGKPPVLGKRIVPAQEPQEPTGGS